MYVIIDWHVLYEGNPNVYKEEAKEFFSQVANRYKNIPNIIYEICNEPNKDETTWEEIKKYANEIIPEIRKINQNAIIIVGTPSWSHDVDYVVGNELNFDNIMYTCHMYTSSLTTEKMDKFKSAVENSIPIFVTEFGTAVTGWGTQDGLLLENSNLIANYMEENDISWCNWSMSDHYEGLALVKYNQWDNSLNDNILSESGKYIKQLLQKGSGVPTSSVMMAYKEGYAFWNDKYRSNISKIIIENNIDNARINGSLEHWDVSFAKNNSVIAYIQNDVENTGKYVLYISGIDGVYCPPDSRYIFSNFISLKMVDFSNLDTSNVHDMGFMFSGDTLLEDINLVNFKTNNVIYMEKMFSNCSSLKNLDLSNFSLERILRFYQVFLGCTKLESIEMPNSRCKSPSIAGLFSHCESLKSIDLSSFNTQKATNMTGMFSYCYNLESINFGNDFITENVTTMREMFYECNSLKELDLKTFNTSKVTDMYYMFGKCLSLQSLNVQKFNTENVENYEDILTHTNKVEVIIVKDENAKNFIQSRLNETGNNATVKINGVP